MSELPSPTPEALKQEEIFFQGLESKVTVPEKLWGDDRFLE